MFSFQDLEIKVYLASTKVFFIFKEDEALRTQTQQTWER